MAEVDQEIENFLDALESFLENVNKIKNGNKSEQTRIGVNEAMERLQYYLYCIGEIRKKMNELNEAKAKIKDLELRLGGWKKLIPSCFGVADGKFAHHDCDKKTAEGIRNIIREEKIDVRIVLQEFRLQLDKIFPNQSSQKESDMKLVEDFFKR